MKKRTLAHLALSLAALKDYTLGPERAARFAPAAAAQARGLSLVGAEAFAVTPDVPPGLRLSLGGTARRARLEDALRSLAALLAEEPAGRLVV